MAHLRAQQAGMVPSSLPVAEVQAVNVEESVKALSQTDRLLLSCSTLGQNKSHKEAQVKSCLHEEATARLWM